VCVGSLSYPACKAHVPYYIVICGLSGCKIYYSTVSHKRQDFRGGGELNMRSVFWFCLKLWNIFHTNKNPASYYHVFT
jgi:hypothetical protein